MYASSRISKLPWHLVITAVPLLDTTYNFIALYSFSKACLLNRLSLPQLLSDQLLSTSIYHFGAGQSYIFELTWKVLKQYLQVTVFWTAKRFQSYFHFSLNQLTRKACNLHSHITSASSLLILKQSPGWKNKQTEVCFNFNFCCSGQSYIPLTSSNRPVGAGLFYEGTVPCI